MHVDEVTSYPKISQTVSFHYNFVDRGCHLYSKVPVYLRASVIVDCEFMVNFIAKWRTKDFAREYLQPTGNLYDQQCDALVNFSFWQTIWPTSLRPASRDWSLLKAKTATQLVTWTVWSVNCFLLVRSLDTEAIFIKGFCPVKRNEFVHTLPLDWLDAKKIQRQILIGNLCNCVRITEFVPQNNVHWWKCNPRPRD